MADIFGFDLAYVALFVTMIGVGASVVFSSWANRRATVKDVKEHTDLKIDAAVSKVESKLETIEFKVSTHESLLQEIKRVNREDVDLIKKELLTLRAEVTEIEKSGTGDMVRAQFIEKRLDVLEKKLDTLMERAFEEAGIQDKARKVALKEEEEGSYNVDEETNDNTKATT